MIVAYIKVHSIKTIHWLTVFADYDPESPSFLAPNEQYWIIPGTMNVND